MDAALANATDLDYLANMRRGGPLVAAATSTPVSKVVANFTLNQGGINSAPALQVNSNGYHKPGNQLVDRKC